MSNKAAVIGRWHYTVTKYKSDENGNRIIISKSSVSPAEIYEWGIDLQNQPYELYKWCEDDFYEDSCYYKVISKEELIEQIDKIILLFTENGFYDNADEYRKIRSELTQMMRRKFET